MPVVAFACPPGKKKHGEVHDVEHCVTRCDEQCYSPFLMTAIYGVNVRNHHKGRYVSATSLPSCKRRLKLERTVPYAEEYQNLYAAFRGTITHTVVEEAMATKFPSGRSLESLGYIAEWRMLVGFCLLHDDHGAFEVDPDVDVDDMATYAQTTCPKCDALGIAARDQSWIFLGGTLDGGSPVFDFEANAEGTIFIDEDGTAHYKLSDLKTKKEYAIAKFVKGDAENNLHPQISDDHVWQARVYSYLAARARVPKQLADRGIKRIKMVRSDIQAFAMGEAPWTGGGTYRWKDHFKNPLKDWPMYEIDLATDEVIEAFIRPNAKLILESLILDEQRGPVRDEAQSWLCNYCAFQGSDFCPNPDVEAGLIRQGMTPDEAFKEASTMQMAPKEQWVAPLTEIDTQNIDNFFRRQRGEAPAEKLVKPRAPRKKKDAA